MFVGAEFGPYLQSGSILHQVVATAFVVLSSVLGHIEILPSGGTLAKLPAKVHESQYVSFPTGQRKVFLVELRQVV